MKGIVFNLLEDVVASGMSAAIWDELLDETGLDGAFTAIGDYPDESLLRLVGALARRRKEHADTTLRWFARNAAPMLGERYPQFFMGHRTLRTFLPTVDGVIHREVRKIYPGAGVPSLRCSESASGEIVMEYRSPRRLCMFAEGLIEGSADHFGETVTITQPYCTQRGHPYCRIVCVIG